MAIYHLQSSPMVHTPGLVKAAQATAKTDKLYWVRVFHEGYGLDPEAAAALVMGEVAYTVDAHGDVVFEHKTGADIP